MKILKPLDIFENERDTTTLKDMADKMGMTSSEHRSLVLSVDRTIEKPNLTKGIKSITIKRENFNYGNKNTGMTYRVNKKGLLLVLSYQKRSDILKKMYIDIFDKSFKEY